MWIAYYFVDLSTTRDIIQVSTWKNYKSRSIQYALTISAIFLGWTAQPNNHNVQKKALEFCTWPKCWRFFCKCLCNWNSLHLVHGVKKHQKGLSNGIFNTARIQTNEIDIKSLGFSTIVVPSKFNISALIQEVCNNRRASICWNEVVWHKRQMKV